ncbi:MULTISPECIES: hypothetical protein [Methylorubrum]|uniref:hypothetical protein n=1 Tax=Methylorubrum TaxID=2282523 RepID=UPI00209ECA59|nr:MULTISPECIES: hypothetical protein [Methylorubrum]MCP1551661.1 methylthioribose-1-phosphate isomerase [Methylorubrum zatmanii]MCP1556589.1 methylthioribose-1-phosphate isomerase [Methylorubrum extorquens]MCP1581996.1 methylthioribose-1-phosphate isomerase [Methylorubrum extorquens]
MLPALTRRGLVAALTLPALAGSVRSAPADPIFAAIALAQSTDDALAARLSNLNEDDAEAVRLADEACDAADDAFNALRDTRPTTANGFRALVQFYADQAELNEPHCCGGLYLRHVLAALPEVSA